MQPIFGPATRLARVYGTRPWLYRTLCLTIASKASIQPATAHWAVPITALRRNLYSTQPPRKDTDTVRPDESNQTVSNTSTQNEPAANELPSAMENRRGALNQRFSHVMDNLQTRVLTASQTLNDITGYTSIDGIKAENEVMEKSLANAQERVRVARQTYKTSNTKRAATQREVTTLLARKDTWSPNDLERFTELYRVDHILEGEVVAAQENLTEAEADEQSLNQRLNAGILKRYHEEQIWSDRIRRASTWGTWGLMGMNFLLFVVLQFFAEPWRRRRLVKGVVEQEKEILEGVRIEMETLKTSLEQNFEKMILQSAPAVAIPKASQQLESTDADAKAPPLPLGTWKEIMVNPSLWQAKAADLWSERQLDISMRDASLLALESALAGAVLAGGVALLIMRQP